MYAEDTAILLKLSDVASSLAPIALNNQTFAVHAFPWFAIGAFWCRYKPAVFDLINGSLLEAHDASFLQKRQSPSTFLAFLINVLHAHAMPQDVIISKRFPSFADLAGSTESLGVEVGEDLDADFRRKDVCKVNAEERFDGICDEGKLRSAAS